MATVTGPLHSDAARKQFGHAMIFQQQHGRCIVKRYAVPGPTPGARKMNQTAAQLALQAKTGSWMTHWATLTDEQKATWDALAIPADIQRANAFLQFNFQRDAVGLPPTDVYPPAEPTTNSLTVVDGDPAPETSVAGVYLQTADHNGKPTYTRPGEPTRVLWYDPTYPGWVLNAGPTGEASPQDLRSDTAEPAGDYYDQAMPQHFATVSA